MSGTLEKYLVDIRDRGPHPQDPAIVSAARALLDVDPRVPEEIRSGLLQDDPADDAAALLAMLGAGDAFGSLFCAAIHDLAGPLDPPLDAEQERELALPLGLPVAEAVRAVAGEIPSLWSAIAPLIGAMEEAPVADAVRAAAGEMRSVWPAVASAIGAGHASSGELRPLPKPANSTRWSLRGLALVAAASLVSVAVWRWPEPTTALAVESIASGMIFANIEETQIVELSYGEVNVVQVEGDQGALILWVDDTEGGI